MPGIRFGDSGDFLDYDERDAGGFTGGRLPIDLTQTFPGGAYDRPERPVSVQDEPVSGAVPQWDSGKAMYDAVKNLYRTALGRSDAQITDPEVFGWINGTGGDYSAIQRGIYGSDEAKAYGASRTAQGNALKAAAAGSSASQGGLPALTGRTTDANIIRQYIAAWASMPGADPSLANDPEYWVRSIVGRGGLGPDNTQYWQDASVGPSAFFRNPNRESGGAGSGLQTTGGYGNGTNPGGFDDPSSVFFLNEVLNRIAQLKQPRHDPAEDQLAQLIQQLVARSQQNPYTAGEDAALTAHYREPLTMARDAELRRNRESASARGFLPSSGLLRRMDTDVSNSYIRGIAQGANDLGVRAVDEKTNRALQAIQALSGLVQNNRTTTDRADAINNQILQLAEIFPQFDERRLGLLLNASGEGPGSAISGLTQLGSLGLNASRLNAANSAGNASAWGQILGYILENL